MNGADLERLGKTAELLALIFYVLTLTALVMTLAGSIGSGFVLLVLGSCAHIGRAALEEFVEKAQRDAQRSNSGLRAKADRGTKRTRSTRRAAA